MMSMRVSRETAAQTSMDGECVRKWLAEILDERINPTAPLEELLHDGILLCRVINRIHPDAIQTINGSGSTQFLLRDVCFIYICIFPFPLFFFFFIFFFFYFLFFLFFIFLFFFVFDGVECGYFPEVLP